MTIEIIFGVVMLILLILVIVLWIKNRTVVQKISEMNKAQQSFMKGKKGEDLEQVLLRLAKDQTEQEKTQQYQEKQIKLLEKAFARSTSRIGVVRFNPFSDTGSNQSFAVALLDKNDNGILISSLYTRNGTSVYAKPIQKGESEFDLTEEEQRAIQSAV